MNDIILSPTPDAPLSLNEEIKKKLNNYEDFISHFIQLNEASNFVSWVRADLLNDMVGKLGEKSMAQLSRDMAIPLSTIINYVRTSRAFPPDKRDPMLTFTHHLQASFADSYDEKSGTFESEKRLSWINQSNIKNLSVKRLRTEMKEEKEKEDTGVVILPCVHCGGSEGKINNYHLYQEGDRKQSHRIKLHEDCFLLILEFIHADKEIK